MELCAGTLQDFIDSREENRTSNANIIDWLYQMARGLEYIHSKKLAHRDIKPGNILLSKKIDEYENVLKISDFGFCKPTSEQGSYSLVSGLKGTITYMAPELFKLSVKESVAKERATIASDVFSLGCVFFQLLFNAHPFGDKASDIILNLNKGNPALFKSKDLIAILFKAKQISLHFKQNIARIITRRIFWRKCSVKILKKDLKCQKFIPKSKVMSTKTSACSKAKTSSVADPIALFTKKTTAEIWWLSKKL
jgi:serine/threonine protein kinase